ncbi:Gamma-glutamylputrescine oxidoreductase [Marinomonas aquimarina]|uniref:Gamma-glutamylputrescine oxidoreductase n=1 Tax=Marinomonas aquimarina TaxID=295068 RepID=A0A1A8TIC8_9GAMM|nr:FAD-binding oxidoreductase [Marinomonas aquimarina]SBS32184.1 Gamma-glutamylputrescine oxidoreductase [Marinomonas aquimarina]
MTQKKITRLPKDPGPAAWNSIIEPDLGFASVSTDIEADWVIVGGGWSGLAAARRLSQLLPSDESIVLLEAKRLGEGPAGRNSGFMIDLPHDLNSDTYAGNNDHDLKQIKLNRQAIDFAESAAFEYGMPKAVFSRSGKITAAATEQGIQHLESYSKHLVEMGEAFKFKSAEEMLGITGSSFYIKGLQTEGGAMVQPAAFIRACANGLRQRVQFFENSPVIELNSGTPHVLKTPAGKVRARNIILAVNGHIQSFGFYPKRLLHVFTFASMTRKLSPSELQALGGQSDWGILPADPMGTTVRKISNYSGSGDRLIIRNLATLNQSLEAPETDMRRAKAMQDHSFKNRFPMLKGVDMEYRWGGRLCLSLNSMPAFGELEERIWSACCQNGLGTVKGTLSGIAAAELAVLGSSDLLTDFLEHQAPSKLPPEPFLSLGANMTMRWKQWQAGKEL